MARVAHFLADPIGHLPARRPDSRRRTSSVDMVGHVGGELELIGTAHDDDGSTASVRASVAPDRTLSTLSVRLSDTLGAGPDTSPLLGRLVGRGFRAAVDAICTPETLEAVLLCELPVAALLSGYGQLYVGGMPGPLSDGFIGAMPVDICAGWETSGTMMQLTRADRMVPTPDGPPVGRAAAIDDSWHEMAPLLPGTMRRQRLIDRCGDEVWAMFRDTYARVDGTVIVLHEYTATALLTSDPAASGGGGDRSGPHSRSSSRVLSCTATPRVLPWAECPGAAASAARVEGQPLAQLRALVKDDLVGTSTCTHLNDLLASLAQADALVSA